MLRALESFHVGDRLVAAAELVHDHDEVVAGREHLFEAAADETPAKRPTAARAKS